MAKTETKGISKHFIILWTVQGVKESVDLDVAPYTDSAYLSEMNRVNVLHQVCSDFVRN